MHVRISTRRKMEDARKTIRARSGKLKLPFYDIAVRNLTYKVAIGSKRKGTSTQKVLLNGINAEAYHGQILGIVGSSGAGKTTFLDALAGRIERRSVEGEVFVNGDLFEGSLERVSGYLMQDDALFPFLTVRETFLYSALLSLPSSMTLAQKKIQVDSMLTRLGLEQCADTRVGNERIRGVSGGERRRVSIGSDLIHDPAIIFLDEPTSGLDSRAALNVMENLKVMAQTGARTALVTVHQPSYRMIEVIDRVLVLARGNVIYHGHPSGIKHYFDPIGRSMPDFTNVIEYAIDIIEEFEPCPEGLTPLIELRESTLRLETLEDSGSPPPESHSIPKPSKKHNKKAVGDERRELGLGLGTHIEADYSSDYATSFHSEWIVLWNRTQKNIIRTPDLFVTRIFVMLTVGFVFSTLFWRLKVDAKGARLRLAFFTFLVANLAFTSIEAMGVFIEERRIFMRERARRAYRTSSYVISGMAVTVPFLMIFSTIIAVSCYFAVGLVLTVEGFLLFTLTTFLALSMANSFVCFFSTMTPSFAVGNTITTTIMSYFFLFSGFFVPRPEIPRYWIWLHYLSIFKYPYEAYLQNEFGARRLIHRTWGSSGSTDEVLAYTGISLKPEALYLNVFIMILLTAAYRVMMWASLKFLIKSTRS